MSTHGLYPTLKALRPVQWLKNLVLYAPLIFSGLLFSTPATSEHPDELPYFITVTYGVIIFCILASSVYLINDIVDRDADRAHPFKKKRPIASGALSVPFAFFLSMLGIILVILLSLPLGVFFKFLVLGYLSLQVAYTFKLKNIPILDVCAIASAFVIRVYAGATLAYIHLNAWFLLTLISGSLFLAVGKRQSERTLMTSISHLGKTRATLKHYSERLLDQYTSVFATATWVSYALFTFQYQFVHPNSNLSLLYPALPKIIRPEKLLMFTVPVAIVGIMRYLQLIYESNEGETPARVIVKDKALLSLVILLVLMIVAVLYGPPLLNDWF